MKKEESMKTVKKENSFKIDEYTHDVTNTKDKFMETMKVELGKTKGERGFLMDGVKKPESNGNIGEDALANAQLEVMDSKNCMVNRWLDENYSYFINEDFKRRYCEVAILGKLRIIPEFV